jgi:hypothetical protein
MELHLIKEEPENSGHYVDTGLTFDRLETALEKIGEIKDQVGRFALRVYEAMAPDSAHAADKAATQAAADARNNAGGTTNMENKPAEGDPVEKDPPEPPAQGEPKPDPAEPAKEAAPA